MLRLKATAVTTATAVSLSHWKPAAIEGWRHRLFGLAAWCQAILLVGGVLVELGHEIRQSESWQQSEPKPEEAALALAWAHWQLEPDPEPVTSTRTRARKAKVGQLGGPVHSGASGWP